MTEQTSATSWENQQIACAPCKDSDQHGHSPRLIRVFACAQWVAEDPKFLHADTEDFDQTGQMPRLIWVFAGRKGHLVGFVMRRLTCFINELGWCLRPFNPSIKAGLCHVTGDLQGATFTHCSRCIQMLHIQNLCNSCNISSREIMQFVYKRQLNSSRKILVKSLPILAHFWNTFNNVEHREI